MKDLRRCNQRGKRVLSWTLAMQAPANISGVEAGSIRRAAPAWGLAQFGREVFCPWRPLDDVKPWQTRTFAATELAPSMTLKSNGVQKP